MVSKDLLKEYALICAKEKQVLGKKAELKLKIESQLPQEPTDIKTELGKYTMVSNKKWEFSPEVQEMEDNLKIMKIDEQESGTAKMSESFGLRFRGV